MGIINVHPAPLRVVDAERPETAEATSALELNAKAEVLSSRAATMLLSKMRAKSATQAEFVHFADRLMRILAEEALARLATRVTVKTPSDECSGLEPPDSGCLGLVDIMRSGGILLEAVRQLCPDSKTAKILIQRDEETRVPALFYSKLPDGIQDLQVIICDPVLASGSSVLMAIDVLKQAGVREEDILFVNVAAAPQGLRALAERAPGVRVLCASLAKDVTEQGTLVPGLGDFGDRYFGTKGYKEGLWGTDGR